MLLLLGLSACSWRCCCCSDWSWQTGPGLARLYGSRDTWPGSCSMLETQLLPSSLLLHPVLARKCQPQGCQLGLCSATCITVCIPKRKGDTGNKGDDKKQGYTSYRGRCKADRGKWGLCVGSRWALFWVLTCFGLDLYDHEISSPSGTRWEESQ